MQLADQAALDNVDGVVVQNAVMTLMARRQMQLLLLRDAAHALALTDGLAHQLFGQHMLAGFHRFDGDRVMQMQGEGDDHALDLRIFEQFFVIDVDLHMVFGGVFGLVAVFLHQARASHHRARRALVAVEGAVHVVRADVGDGDDVDVVRVERADKDTPFIAGADDGDRQRVLHLAVAEVKRAEARSGNDPGGDAAEHAVIDDVVVPHDAFDAWLARAAGHDDADVERPVRDQQAAINGEFVRAPLDDVMTE